MKDHIRNTALRMIEDVGVAGLSHSALCEAAEVRPGSFRHIMGMGFTEFKATLPDSGMPLGRIVKVNTTRMTREQRYEQIMATAVTLAGEHGYLNVTRKMVADAVGVTADLVKHYVGPVAAFHEQILSEAIRREYLPVVAQAVVNKAAAVSKASDDLKRRALEAAL